MVIINMLLLWILMSLLVVQDLYADELYCKIENTTVLTSFSDGRADTIALDLGCTTIRKGQELLKIDFRPVDDKDFKQLFIDEDQEND